MLIGARYCFGGSIAAHLLPFKTLDGIVLCRPSMLTVTELKLLTKVIDVGVFIHATPTPGTHCTGLH